MTRKTAILRNVVAVSLSAALLSGCTSPAESSASDVVTTASKTLDFAYDTSVDQLTHMSCTNMPMSSPLPFNGSAYFTFRMGAYNSGGITLKDSFYSALKKFSFDSQAEVLAGSAANTNTILQLAVRSRENRQAIKVRSGTTAVSGQDYFNMLGTLGASDISQTLVQNPANGRVKHIRNGSAGGYYLEGSLYFTQGAAVVQDVRDFTQGIGSTGAGMLAVTYTNGTDFNARSPADVTKGSTVNKQVVVYGRGYIPTFSQPAVSGLYTSYPRNTVTAINESSLDGTTLSPLPSWTCPATLQLRIVRLEDLGKAGANCVRQSDPQVLTPELKLVRNTLRVEDWYVDLARRCMIPKHAGAGCYGPITDIKYSMGDACGTDGAGNSNCVQYASTCYRN